MKKYDIQFELSYSGASSEDHEIDLYDVSQALIGFQRSLALTTHLVLNGEIITQSPSLKGAEIYAFPAEAGSWKVKAGILVLSTAAYQVGTTPSNTPLGHLIFSAYDYVVSESLGFHVDYNKSLGQLYEESKEKNIILPKEVREGQLDSLIEKCSTAITEIHRPIYKTKTAETARISTKINNNIIQLNPTFSFDSFRYIIEENISDEFEVITGSVSSYNSNTFKGRIYVVEEERAISFELSENVRNEPTIQLVVESLRANALRGFEVETSFIFCKVQKIKSRSGYLKGYKVLLVSDKLFNV
jgi:hypothetical protein